MTVVGIREVSLSMSVDLDVSPYLDYMYPEVLIGRTQIYSLTFGGHHPFVGRTLPILDQASSTLASPSGLGGVALGYQATH